MNEENSNLQKQIKELENKVRKGIKLPAYIAIIVAFISLVGSFYISYSESENASNQKRLEVEKDLIIEAINGNSRTQIKHNIRFFIDAGFFLLSKDSLEKLLLADSLMPIIDEQKTAETEFLNSFSITYPKDNTEIETAVISIGGVYTGLPIVKDKIIVMAYINGFFYPLEGTTIVAKNKWQFDNVSLGLTGNIKLIACISTVDGVSWINSKINNNYERFKTLHKGITPIDFITIIKK